jgi:hypothetical protein
MFCVASLCCATDFMPVPDIFLPVVFAKTNLSFPTGLLGLYVEIRLDGSTARHTSVIEGDTAPFWNEQFCMYV